MTSGSSRLTFPFVSLPVALGLLRVCVAGLLMAHAATRLAQGTIPRFGAFLTSKGLPAGVALVWAITIYELCGGALMAIGWRVRWFAAGFIAMLGVGIILIHAGNGWWVGEHGTGGMEYSVALMVALVVIAASDESPR